MSYVIIMSYRAPMDSSRWLNGLPCRNKVYTIQYNTIQHILKLYIQFSNKSWISASLNSRAPMLYLPLFGMRYPAIRTRTNHIAPYILLNWCRLHTRFSLLCKNDLFTCENINDIFHIKITMASSQRGINFDW